MSHELDGLAPIVVAALKSPPGTTVEEIRAQFYESKHESATPTKEPAVDPADFNRRFEDASYEWHRANSWSAPMPLQVRDRIIEQIRADIAWEAASRRH